MTIPRKDAFEIVNHILLALSLGHDQIQIVVPGAELFAAVPLANLKKYLLVRGWVRSGEDKRGVASCWKLERPHDPVAIIAPEDSSIRHYGSMVKSVVEVLAEIQFDSEYDVLREMLIAD